MHKLCLKNKQKQSVMIKKLYLLFILSALFIFSCQNRQRSKLVKNGKTAYQIIISDKANPNDLRAAKILQDYLQQISNANFVINSDTSQVSEYELLIGNTNRKECKDIEKERDGLSEDGFLIRTLGTKLIFAGGTDKGIIYGIYHFLEKYLNCRKYSADVTIIPKNDDIMLPQINDTENPAFSYRELHFPDPRQDKAYCEWHRLDLKEGKDTWGMFVHTFDDLVPPEKYFDKHPEYFTFLNVLRIPDGQLCLSNPDVFDLVVQGLKERIKQKPEALYWSVSQNDTYKACTCDNCKALDEKYGGPSGTMLYFVNKVAKKFPDKVISMLAYQYTRSAPKNIKPEKNVNIMFCSIECNRSRPIATDSLSKSFRKDAEDWTKLTDNIFMWDYVVQFRNMLSPFPNLRVLQPNIQFFRDHHMKMMFQQGTGGHKSEFYELRQYLIAKLLWNPDVDVDSVMTDFLNGYYGKAAPFIKKYIYIMHSSLEKRKGDLGIYGFPYDGINTYLTPKLIKTYERLFDDAEKSVKDEADYLKRVKFARLPLEFAILDISLRNVNDELSYFTEKDGKRTVNKEMIARLHKFTEEAKLAGVDKYWEHGNEPDNYMASVEQFVEKSAKPHLALGKDVKLLTKATDKYPVGGAKALADGLRGVDDYHFNWLGFEGDDLIAIIDLGSPVMATSVTANFLQDQNSWIFLPTDFEVAISNNGKQFITVGKKQNKITNEQEIKIKPFNISFYPKEVRYLKITAKNIKTCPGWHPGAGFPAWIFCDELIVE